MQNELINCGIRRVQTLDRISLHDICNLYSINVGDTVEVYIKVKESPTCQSEAKVQKSKRLKNH